MFDTERQTLVYYAVYLRDGEEHLYDDLEDPLQMNNLVGCDDHKAVLADIKEKMRMEMERVNDRFHPVDYYRQNWVRDRIIQRIKAN